MMPITTAITHGVNRTTHSGQEVTQPIAAATAAVVSSAPATIPPTAPISTAAPPLAAVANERAATPDVRIGAVDISAAVQEKLNLGKTVLFSHLGPWGKSVLDAVLTAGRVDKDALTVPCPPEGGAPLDEQTIAEIWNSFVSTKRLPPFCIAGTALETHRIQQGIFALNHVQQLSTSARSKYMQLTSLIRDLTAILARRLPSAGYDLAMDTDEPKVLLGSGPDWDSGHSDLFDREHNRRFNDQLFNVSLVGMIHTLCALQSHCHVETSAIADTMSESDLWEYTRQQSLEALFAARKPMYRASQQLYQAAYLAHNPYFPTCTFSDCGRPDPSKIDIGSMLTFRTYEYWRTDDLQAWQDQMQDSARWNVQGMSTLEKQIVRVWIEMRSVARKTAEQLIAPMVSDYLAQRHSAVGSAPASAEVTLSQQTALRAGFEMDPTIYSTLFTKVRKAIHDAILPFRPKLQAEMAAAGAESEQYKNLVLDLHDYQSEEYERSLLPLRATLYSELRPLPLDLHNIVVNYLDSGSSRLIAEGEAHIWARSAWARAVDTISRQ